MAATEAHSYSSPKVSDNNEDVVTVWLFGSVWFGLVAESQPSIPERKFFLTLFSSQAILKGPLKKVTSFEVPEGIIACWCRVCVNEERKTPLAPFDLIDDFFTGRCRATGWNSRNYDSKQRCTN